MANTQPRSRAVGFRPVLRIDERPLVYTHLTSIRTELLLSQIHKYTSHEQTTRNLNDGMERDHTDSCHQGIMGA
jgi:hypothetical protein